MKKHTIIILISLLVFGCNNSIELKNDLEKFSLKGKLKTMRWTPYEAVEKFGEITKGEIKGGMFIKHDYSIFNEYGNLIELQDFLSSGDLFKKTLYKYNSQNKIEEADVYSSDGNLEKKTKYRYKENGCLMENAEYNSDGELLSKENHLYNQRGKRIETQEINSVGVPQDKWTYKYNDNGDIIETRWYNSDGRMYSKDNYIYNSEGDLIEETEFDEKGKIEHKKLYGYDYINNIIKAELYDSNGILTSRGSFIFISEDNLEYVNEFRRELIRRNEVPDLYFLLMMNTDIFEVEAVETFIPDDNPARGHLKYTYEYDKQGNWIKRIEYDERENAKTLFEREITYYE